MPGVPADVKERFVVTDRTSGQAWWQYGAANETPQDAAAKRMSDDRLRDRISALRRAGMFMAAQNHR